MMNKQLLFVDGSVDPKLKIGCGAYLVVKESDLLKNPKSNQVIVSTFKDTSSTKLELQTLIWALTEIHEKGTKILVYTDSQNIIGLPSRRKNLEQNGYLSGKNKLLNNHALYREFYTIMDQLDCELIKVEGHLTSVQKNDIDRLFTYVDRASRKSLKSAIQVFRDTEG